MEPTKDLDEQIDEILFDLTDLSYASFTTQEEADRVADQLDYDRAEAKQAITSLIKELVAEAKPEVRVFDDGINDATYFQQKIVDQFEQNLLKALEDRS